MKLHMDMYIDVKKRGIIQFNIISLGTTAYSLEAMVSLQISLIVLPSIAESTITYKYSETSEQQTHGGRTLVCCRGVVLASYPGSSLLLYASQKS